MDRLDPARHESVLHTGLLARAAAAPHADLATRTEIADELFAILRSTAVATLWRTIGEHLLALAVELSPRAEAALADGMPAWRLQPLSDDPTITGLLRALLADAPPRVRVAALRGLAPRVSAPEVRGDVLACLRDDDEHVRSTTIEVLRPVAREPEVRDALLALFAPAVRLPGRVDRALRRSLRILASDPAVQPTLVRELGGARAHVAAAALAGATPDEALADALLAVLATYEHITTIAPAFTPVAHLERVTDAFNRRLTHGEYAMQAALRIVGRGVTAAARDAVIAALAHETNWIRWTALEQLAHRLADPAARGAVIASLADPDDSVRMIALRILGALADDPEVRAAARALLADSSQAVTIAAAGLLARTGPDRAAWAVLAPFVTRDHGRVYTAQWQAIDAFTQLGALVELAEVRDALAPMLAAYQAERRAAVARCLADAPPSEAIADVLAEHIEHDEPIVADAAYLTLRRWTGDPATQ